MVTPKVEDYLKTIHGLQDGDTRAAPSAIAAAMGVKPPTVTKMLQRMDEDGLVRYERYRGARLTDRGEQCAIEVVRHHRLLELFLTEHLGYDWAEVHEEADVLEHFITERLEERIADLLGSPDVDPHGEPIPTTDLEIRRDEDVRPLVRFDPDEVAVVSTVSHTDPAVLAFLGDAEVTPGTTLRVTEVAPFGMVTVEVSPSGKRLSLPADVASNIYLSQPAGANVGRSNGSTR